MKKGRTTFIIWMLAPAVLLYAVFVLYPMARAFHLSLYRWSGLSANRTFVGLENFHTLFTESPPEFLKYLGHNATFLLVSMLVVLPLALFFGTVLSGKIRGASTYRGIYLFPNVISMVAVGVLWYFIYAHDYGLVNAALRAVRLEDLQRTWLGDPSTALYAIIATNTWAQLGFYILLFNAGVQNIPASYLEASDLDGAGPLQKFWHVTLPLLWEIFKLGVLYLVIRSLNLFALVYVMNLNQPNSDTDVILTYLYQKGFAENNFGYAAAIASVGFVIILGSVLVFLKVLKRESVEY